MSFDIMSAQAKRDVLEIELKAFEEILEPFKQGSVDTQLIINLDHVKEEVLRLHQRCEKLFV